MEIVYNDDDVSCEYKTINSHKTVSAHNDCAVCVPPQSMAQQTEQHDHRSLYPPIEPYDTGFLKVTDVHTLYYEQSGNAKGNPILFV